MAMQKFLFPVPPFLINLNLISLLSFIIDFSSLNLIKMLYMTVVTTDKKIFGVSRLSHYFQVYLNASNQLILWVLSFVTNNNATFKFLGKKLGNE